MDTSRKDCRTRYRRAVSRLAWLLVPLLLAVSGSVCATVVIIGHPGMPKLDSETVQKVYSGKMIEIGGISVTAVHANIGSALRNRFLQSYLSQDEEKYTAYWTVRRYIGKGVPPKELPTSTDIINFVQSTPGAVGYVDEADIRPGLNVLLRK